MASKKFLFLLFVWIFLNFNQQSFDFIKKNAFPTIILFDGADGDYRACRADILRWDFTAATVKGKLWHSIFQAEVVQRALRVEVLLQLNSNLFSHGMAHTNRRLLSRSDRAGLFQ